MRRRLLVVLLAGLLLVSGCATVPTKGAIRNSNREGLALDAGGVGVQAKAPRADAKPDAIVAGFLEAMSDSRNGFEQARLYMTPQAAAKWKPEVRTIVYDQGDDKVTPDDDDFLLTATRISTIDDRGEWSPAAPADKNIKFTFKMVKVNEQWRVDSVPSGVLLGSNQLAIKLAPRDLYFFSRDRKTLVPDTVYLAQNNLSPGQAATQLVQELLRGPTKRLGNGAISIAPPGTAIQVSVPVELGEATVALNDVAGQLLDDDRHRLAAQIVWTLNQISLKVKITVNGAPLLPEDPGVIQFSTFTDNDPAAPTAASTVPYGLLRGKVQRVDGLDGASEQTVRELNSSQLYPYDAESFAVNLRGDSGAIVTMDGGKHVVAVAKLDPGENAKDEPKPKLVGVDGRVLRPTYDNLDNLWILDRADSSAPRLRVRTRDGVVETLSVDFHGDVPQVLRMAPDGVRALLVLKSAKTHQNTVQTATVQPAPNGKGLMLGQIRDLQVPLVAITDAAWSKKGILVAGRSASGTLAQPWFVNADGSNPQPLPGSTPPFGIETIASNANPNILPVFEDPQGHVHWQTRDLEWVTPEGDDKLADLVPTYPG
ncbi:LpqB family beta-propeller domain-containing protein [Kribbella sp. NPDC058245]|uniref:LpqB family beta-propeller domain-containing protein n=1 Tax=Kribbella sp. NPDC058245 TaxID=3346399 RepID=UPI0036EE8C85